MNAIALVVVETQHKDQPPCQVVKHVQLQNFNVLQEINAFLQVTFVMVTTTVVTEVMNEIVMLVVNEASSVQPATNVYHQLIVAMGMMIVAT